MRWLAVGLAMVVLVSSEELLQWQDPEITESSGLVDLGDRLVTTNDSGDAARLFVVDLEGRTERVVEYGTGGLDVVDVEALAPAGDDEVWVGDIGDNARVRDDVAVHRVRVDGASSDPLVASYRLAYPDGRNYDAESLFADASGRLHVITKQLLGGEVYAAPRELDPLGLNLLEPVGRVGELATDAALMADGRHVLVRGYASASAYALPSWRRVTGFALPSQQQGEAVSVGPDGRVLISSEGAGTPVVEIDVPDPEPDTDPPPSPTASPSTGSAAAEGAREDEERTAPSTATLALLGAAGVGLAGVLAGVLAAVRARRSPQRRTRGEGRDVPPSGRRG